MKMEEYKSALIAFKQVKELYYDTEYIELAHMKTIACHIHPHEFDEAQLYYDKNRNFIKKIEMTELVDEWFRLNRVVERIGFK